MFSVDNKGLQWFLYASLFVGVFKITTFVLSAATMALELTVFPKTNFAKYGAKKGNWALITGASDGIGAEYAKQLASRGFNIVLVSRTQSKLDAIAEELLTKYGVSTKVIAFDASVDKKEHYQLIKNVIDELPLTVLVNNVGKSHEMPVPFLETEDDAIDGIITVNNLVTLKITKAVVPVIEATVAKQSTKGLVLTMGSFGGLLPSPYLATYSGSKAFLQNWSNCLSGELANKNIDVEFVLSYLVTSAMSKIRRTSMMIPNPKQFVQATLSNVGNRVGAQERYGTITPFWSHALMHFGIHNAVGVYSKIANTINLSMHKDIRRRALKKQQKQK